jgi:hypothetical protein
MDADTPKLGVAMLKGHAQHLKRSIIKFGENAY